MNFFSKFPFLKKKTSSKDILSINDVNIYSKNFQCNFLKYYEEFHNNKDGVLYVEQSNCYIVFKYDFVKNILNNTEDTSFSLLDSLDFFSDLVLLGSDEEKHMRNKKLILQNISSLKKETVHGINQYSDLCFNQLINDAHSGSAFDLVDDLVNPYVLSIILKEFGVSYLPEELNIFSNNKSDRISFIRDTFSDWKNLNDIISYNLEKKFLSENMKRLLSLINEEDNIAEKDFIRFLVFAGSETTSSLILFSLHTLFTKPQLLTAILADEKSIDSFLSEVLRLYSPVQFAYRSSTSEIAVGSKIIPANSIIALSIGAANRDPNVFTAPNEFNVERNQKHISFGAGKYKCIGEHLATYTAKKFLLNFIPIIKKFELIDNEKFDHSLTLGNCIHRISSLIVNVKY